MEATTEIDIPGSAHWPTVIAGAASGTYDALLIDAAFECFNVTDLAYLVAVCPDVQIVVDALDHRLARRLNGFPKDRLLLVPNRDPQPAKRVIRMLLNPTLYHTGEPLRVPGVIAALFLDERFGHYRDHRMARVLLMGAFREQLGPRQRTVWWRIRAMFWKRSEKQWGHIQRTGVGNLSA
jgi:hypothetical protein